jgi:peptidoglycan/LPS O-acetylase OafA/YrhL
MEHFHYAFLALVALALIVPALRRWGTAHGIEAAAAPAAVGFARRGSLQQRMGGGDNLLLLRAIAASIVIYAHGYALTPAVDDADRLTPVFGIYAGSVAVYAFFFVSGFLVTGSWQRQPSLGRFLAARVLRIVPAYALCLVVCALAIGAAISTLPAREYFADPEPWRFVGWNLTFPESMVYVLPGTFEGMPHQAINGSLSTLPGEVRAYALLAIFGLLGLLDRTPRLLLALLIAFALVVFAGFQVPLVGIGYFIPMLGYFALGALAWSARGVLPLHGGIALLLIGLAVVCRGGPLHGYAFALALGYSCLWFAYVPRWPLGFNRFGDYSYGIYLWGFPMQQIVLHLVPDASAMSVNLLAWPLALGCAVISWHAVEAPALALSRRRRPEVEAAATSRASAA